MTTVPENIKNIRTLEDVSYLLNILYTNLNNLDKMYYDMFINPNPMVLELERYDETGKLVTVTLNNRAKDILQTYTGAGNPNGVQIAKIGALYIDTDTTSIYYKGSGSDSYGWILLWSSLNLVANVDFLKPNGNGSQLTALDAAKIASGILPVVRGGSGTGTITGLVKGNGTEPFTGAIDGTDFLGPNSFVGLIAYYPINMSRENWLNFGWLPCDGSELSKATYERLWDKIGYTYGGSGDTFKLPDLMSSGGYFVRCWNGSAAMNTVQNDQVGGHTHSLSGNTGAGTGHSHSGGSLSHTHTITLDYRHGRDGSYQYGPHWGGGDRDDSYASGANIATTSGSASWSGVTSTENAHTHPLSGNTGNNNTGAETRVKNKMLIPIIKY